MLVLYLLLLKSSMEENDVWREQDFQKVKPRFFCKIRNVNKKFGIVQKTLPTFAVMEVQEADMASDIVSTFKLVGACLEGFSHQLFDVVCIKRKTLIREHLKGKFVSFRFVRFLHHPSRI